MNRLRRNNTNSLGLIDAAQNGDVARVKAKLRAGKDVNSKDEARARASRGHRALARAHAQDTRACHARAARSPGVVGGCVCAPRFSDTPLHAAPQWGQMPLLWAAYQGHLDVAQVLVDAGAALSATDKARAALTQQRSNATACATAGTPSSGRRDAARD
jgi:hypothetical protein